MLPRGAFTVPLLLVFAASAVTVPAPENVTLSCDNLKTRVSWEYGDREPGTVFNVTIVSSDIQNEEHITSELHFDLSSFVWASATHITAYHSVNVMAIRQGQRSKPVTSNALSFTELRHTHTCQLDFPPVNLMLSDSGRTVSFENPFFFYEELRGADKAQGASFEFKVLSNGSEPLEFVSCAPSQRICRYDLPSTEDMDECVQLNGRLNLGKKPYYVDFKETEPVCPTLPPEDHSVAVAVTLSVLLCVFIVTIAVIVKCVLNEQAHLKDTPRPRTLLVHDGHMRSTGMFKPQSEQTSQLICTPMGKDVDCEGREDCELLTKASRASVSSGDLDPTDDDSMKTDSVHIDYEQEEDEEEDKEEYEIRGVPGEGYDRPHVMDMGDGELVQGYK